ncbi:hypothetical protein [Vibrio diazotrophicus]|uniref:hypothetical protein n=1 Tax=Vibrio diazotrophicus TaxID=685 RepID=UPI00142D2384|nr:hypothetical protein [Vibrio diazotrophicus]NIY94526.1 hypothetical protein [Vibrio diazotrophicus]
MVLMVKGNESFESYSENVDKAGTIESHGAGFLSSLCTLLLLCVLLRLLLWSIGVTKTEEVHKALNTLLDENFGFLSFLSSILAMASSNGMYLLAKESWIKRTEILRVHVQNYLVGLSGTAFVIGYFGLELLEAKDYLWILALVCLTWIVTALTGFIKSKVGRRIEIFAGVGYLTVILLVCIFWR